MTECKHLSKAKLYGPFAASEAGGRNICKDCLAHLSWDSSTNKKASLDESKRLHIEDLLNQLTSQALITKLDEKSKEFILQTAERYHKYKDNTRISEGQQRWLDSLQMKFKLEPIYDLRRHANENKKIQTKEVSFDIDSQDVPF